MRKSRNPVYFQDFFNKTTKTKPRRLFPKKSQSCLFSGFFQQDTNGTVAEFTLDGSQSCLFSGFFQRSFITNYAGIRSHVAILFIFRIFSTLELGRTRRRKTIVAILFIFRIFSTGKLFLGMADEEESQSCLFSGFFQLSFRMPSKK